jgi:hypothetical protein
MGLFTEIWDTLPPAPTCQLSICASAQADSLKNHLAGNIKKILQAPAPSAFYSQKGNTMRRFALTLLTLLALAPFALAQQNGDNLPQPNLNGKWTLRWFLGDKEAGTRNTIQLTETNGAFSGNFLADSGESCPITGTLENSKAVLHVTCAKFSISLDGLLKGNEIDGDFTAYGNSHGIFRMEKLTCWLPEGCGGA